MLGTFFEPTATDDILPIINDFVNAYGVAARVVQTKEYIQCVELLVGKRIAYYHSGMMPMMRELIEYLMKSELISVLVATDAWPKGDYRINSVVFMNLHKFNGESLQYETVSPQLYDKTCDSLLAKTKIYDNRAKRITHPKHIIHCIDFFDSIIPFPDYSRLISNNAHPLQKKKNASCGTILKLISGHGISIVYPFFTMKELREREQIDSMLHLLRTEGFLNSADQLSAKGELASRITPVDPLLLIGALDTLETYSVEELIVYLSYFVNQGRKVMCDNRDQHRSIDIDTYSHCTKLWDDMNGTFSADYDRGKRNDDWVKLVCAMLRCDKKYNEMNLYHEEEFRYMLDKLVKICFEMHNELRTYPSIQHSCREIIQKFRYVLAS
jgi:superfamily II RNA helicase